MGSLAHHLATMAYQNAWANHRLLAACAKLTQEDFAAARTSFFPSIAHTLNHLVTVDRYYVDAIERWAHRAPMNPDHAGFFTPEQPFETCASLSVAQHAVDRRLVEVCVALEEARLVELIPISRFSGITHDTPVRLLSHLFGHQLHHRGQVHAMLAGTPVKPPQLDEFFCASEAHLRAAELAELGYTEALIFG